MNVVISGPFGRGSLADEALLAGILVRLKEKKHGVTVLSADPKITHELHDVESVFAGDPTTILSNKPAWEAIGKAHLFVLTSAGAISADGKFPARHWLVQLEYVQKVGLKTALISAGAIPIKEAKERARVQRLLHHEVDGMSTRDAVSKAAVISFGMNANRLSSNGDPTLALPTPAAPEIATTHPRIGLVLSSGTPSRTTFGFDEIAPADSFSAYVRELIELLLKTESRANIVLFHDDTGAVNTFAASLEEINPDRVSTIGADEKIAEIQSELAACSAVLSFSLSGLYLATASETPAAALNTEPGVTEFLTILGSPTLAIAPGDPALAAKTLSELIKSGESIRPTLKTKLIALRKKEAQNGRMMDLLVPRRVERERLRETVGFVTDKPQKLRHKAREQKTFPKYRDDDPME